jgi:hypothetical protein
MNDSGEEDVRIDGESDWEDQDLLTRDLAADRLTEVIVSLEEEIAAAPADIDLSNARLRLERLIETRDRLARGSR